MTKHATVMELLSQIEQKLTAQLQQQKVFNKTSDYLVCLGDKQGKYYPGTTWQPQLSATRKKFELSPAFRQKTATTSAEQISGNETQQQPTVEVRYLHVYAYKKDHIQTQQQSTMTKMPVYLVLRCIWGANKKIEFSLKAFREHPKDDLALSDWINVFRSARLSYFSTFDNTEEIPDLGINSNKFCENMGDFLIGVAVQATEFFDELTTIRKHIGILLNQNLSYLRCSETANNTLPKQPFTLSQQQQDSLTSEEKDGQGTIVLSVDLPYGHSIEPDEYVSGRTLLSLVVTFDHKKIVFYNKEFYFEHKPVDGGSMVAQVYETVLKQVKIMESELLP